MQCIRIALKCLAADINRGISENVCAEKQHEQEPGCRHDVLLTDGRLEELDEPHTRTLLEKVKEVKYDGLEQTLCPNNSHTQKQEAAKIEMSTGVMAPLTINLVSGKPYLYGSKKKERYFFNYEYVQ